MANNLMINEVGQEQEDSRRSRILMRERGVKITSEIQARYTVRKKNIGIHRLGERREQKGKKGRYQEMGKMEEKMVPDMNILVIFSRVHSTGIARNAGGEKYFPWLCLSDGFCLNLQDKV